MSAIPEAAMPITEDWLRSAGFKWHQLERQPDKHWLLWLGSAMPMGFLCAIEDIGVEVAPVGRGLEWFCWLRSDASHRYGRFVHIRHMATTGELVRLIEALTGQVWNPQNNFYGSMLRPDDADRARVERERLDLKMLGEGWSNWQSSEDDDARGRPLLDHMQAAIDAGKAK